METEGCTIPDFKNAKNARKGRRREVRGSNDTNNGGKRVQMMTEDDYSANSKKNCTKMHMEQR